MNKTSRILFGLAAILLVLAYYFPLWKISLDAPQYPEGLGLFIWVNSITGAKEHDLRNINALNHYIGMKPIEPDSIKELKIMPWILGFVIFFGILGAIVNRRKMLLTWIIFLYLLGFAGIADFYKWTYDYGHNLDYEKAAIKVPGMAYQPPIIGKKQILNFTARSYPAAGTWIIFGSVLLGMIAYGLDVHQKKV